MPSLRGSRGDWLAVELRLDGAESHPMNHTLISYMHDHLAGARFAISLLESLRSDQKSSVKRLAEQLLFEIEEDRQVLQRLADKIGRPQNTLKEGAAWIAQKASLWKLGPNGSSLSMFEALEALSLGIMGKLALWRALRVLQLSEPSFAEINFEYLCARAERQFVRVENMRIKLVPLALAPERVAEVA